MMRKISRRRMYFACTCVFLFLLTVFFTWRGCEKPEEEFSAEETAEMAELLASEFANELLSPDELFPVIEGMSASPGEDYVALMLRKGEQSPGCIRVIDASGRLVAETSPSAELAQNDRAVQWFPGGAELLFARSTPLTLPPTGFTDFDMALFILNAKTGDVTPVDMGENEWDGVEVVDSQTLICRIGDTEGEGKSGLYLVVKGNPQWQVSELLPDTSETVWNYCVWGRRTDPGFRLIVVAKSVEYAMTCWNIQLGAEGILRREPICRFRQRPMSPHVSTDGSLLAVDDGRGQVWLFPTEPKLWAARSVPVPPGSTPYSFRPDGGELLIWRVGVRNPIFGMPTHVSLWDLKTPRCRELSIAKEVPSVSWVAWLSNEGLLIDVHGKGIVKLNTKTGKHSYIWRIPRPVEEDKTPEEGEQTEETQ
jgi:hypothetical protein